MRKKWGNKDTSSEGFLNGGNKISSYLRLHHVPDCTGSQAGLDEIGIEVNR